MFHISELESCDSISLAQFINDVRKNKWSLSSRAFTKRPKRVLHIQSQELIDSNLNQGRIGFYILRHNKRIVSCLQIDRKHNNACVVIFSHVETHPDYQKRGIFGLTLGDACLRKACESVECKRVELTTWSFNRKGIPLYKRGGFRAVPGTSLLMENYLPSIVKHPDARPYFDRYDYIRTLQNERSYGYDAVEVDGLSVFEYCWKPRKADDTLRVLVDWQKKEIVRVECNVVDSALLVEETSHV